MRELADYQALAFDCDGVLLDSNRIKTEAFYSAASVYGHEAAQALVDYHVRHGGISRYRKFAYLFSDILHRKGDGCEQKALLTQYAALVRNGLLKCEVAPGLSDLREALPHSRWLVVSGGDQVELREVLAARGVAGYFDGGIFGSPDAKDQILLRELASGNIPVPALFLGDSRFDYQCATQVGMDFVFLSNWSEFQEWPVFFAERPVPVKGSLADLLC